MSNENQEIWKTYPEIPFIEASNLGRVRTKYRVVTGKDGKKYHIKGRILKQQLQKNGYMNVSFRMYGKKVLLLVHRVIAITFLPNPNNLPEVNHKDNNPKNNTVSNLEWCTSQYNNDYKKTFGTTQAELFGRPVFAVNLETGRVLRFKSRNEAARQLRVGHGDIWKVLEGKKIQAGGYWFTEDESEITEVKIREIKGKMYFRGCMIAVNIETSEVFLFDSQREAARQLDIFQQSISKVAKGKLHKTGGYWFCYADENAVEKVRSKFGDEVAKKVEELIREHNEWLNRK